ncbi:MAG: TetR/AcrR family transcriptional regulator [Phenylobacterium sp.]|uniref:TetR/AcrR family transcriptional regulator n=1 Tax=Phenylobacterium sp. TaxID=1871053 RepID=UPI00391AE8B7
MSEEDVEEPGERRRISAEARRDQILDAAEACVRRHGFHGASMAEIAQEADLSVGQIYRYFENKAAIVAALVERDRAELDEKFKAVEALDGDVLKACIALSGDVVERALDVRSAGLMLEVLAESARNPEVMAIVRAMEENDRESATRTFSRLAKPGWTEKGLATRLEMLSALMEGLRTRAIFQPDIDRRFLAYLMGEAVRVVLTAEEPPA